MSATSRYHGIQTAKWNRSDGLEIVYLLRRFLPNPSSMDVLSEHEVTEGDRLDNITARYLVDPEQFWRICDASNAMNPEQLAIIGKRLKIPLIRGA